MNVKKVSENEDKEVWLGTIERPFAFTSPFGDGKFALYLLVTAKDVTEEEQAALSKALVDAGCRYACCAGHKCSTWDDSIDMASVEEFLDAEIPDERFVTTTWHEEETMEQSVRFFRDARFYDDTSPTRFLALQVGASPEREAELSAAVDRVFARGRS